MGAKDKAYATVWTFAPDAPLEARPYGGSITVRYPYNTITYSYDRATNTYLRSVSGEKKQTDAADGIRIAPKNVIVMRMRFGPLNDGHAGAPRLEATVVGSGTAWISTNGRTIKGTWKKTGDHEADEVLRREGQRGDPDRRPDVRPGVDHERGQLSGDLQGWVQHPARDAGPLRDAGPVRLPDPEGGSGSDRGRPGDVRVDRPRLAGHVRPGSGIHLGALTRDRRGPAVDRLIGPDRRQRHGQPIGIAGLDQQAGGADELGDRPNR